MKSNKNFCSTDCKIFYFEKMNDMKIETWTNKKTQSKCRVYRLQGIVSEKDLKDMVKETEINIAKKMNKLKR